jgi:MFS transporter, MHS family, proline/betaine transporter
MAKPSFKTRCVGIIGNILEHYDNALFGLLAPFIAPLFFEKSDPLTALILTYGMLPLGILFRPLGALFFGWMGDRYGRKRALCSSLIGMAAATMIMGCLPTYASSGIYAPIFLALCRIVQNFCASGENVGGAVFILEHTQERQKNFVSSLYNASTIAGILIASALVAFCSIYFNNNDFWRWLYWTGGLTALIALPIRFKLKESEEFVESRRSSSLSVITILRMHYKPLIAITCVAGFSYTTYSLPFTLMNGYIPLVTSVSQSEVATVTTWLLILDMCTLPFFGYLASRISREKIMLFTALFTFCSSFPLLYMLQIPSFPIVIAVRAIIVLCGVAFSATYYSWIQNLVAPQFRYTILSAGHALGSQLIGAPTSAISLWLFKQTGWTGAPALYLMLSSLLAAVMIYRFSGTRARILSDTNR